MGRLRILLFLALNVAISAMIALGLLQLSVTQGWLSEASTGLRVVEVPIAISPTPILNPAIPIIIIDGEYRVIYDPINPEATMPVRIWTPTTSNGSQATTSEGQPAALAPQATESPEADGYTTALPAGCTEHVVSLGESLSFIASYRGVDLDLLLEINGLTIADATSLQPGDALIIPWASCVAALSDLREGRAANTVSPNSNLSAMQLAIITVRSPGSLENEEVVIRNLGATSVDLTGWQLQTEKGVEFAFGAQRLFAGAELRVATRSGANLPTQLFWGLSASVWESGQNVLLIAPGGETHFTYSIP